MTKEQLDKLRDAVERYPYQHTEKSAIPMLISHIDEQQREIDRLRDALITVCNYEGGNYIWWIEQAREALKEVGDD